MRTFFLLFLLASPAFGHQVLFNNPDFLKLADGDPIAGHELYTFCAAAGKNYSNCKVLLAGDGKKKILAARFCVQRFLSPKVSKILDRGNDYELEILEKKFTYGKIWHDDYQDSSEGRHMHGYSQSVLDFSASTYSLRLIQDKISRNHARKYISSRYHFTDPRLSKKEIAAFAKEAEQIKSFPYIENLPDLVCNEKDNDCISGGGRVSKNKVIKAVPPIPSKSSTHAEECLKDELIRITTGLQGVVRD